MAKLFFASFLLSQSLCDFFFSLFFEFLHFSFDFLIGLIHWCWFIQLILSFNFVFIDTHSFRLTSLPLQKCWILVTILMRVVTSTSNATGG